MEKVYSKEGDALKVTVTKEEVFVHNLQELQQTKEQLLAERAWIDSQLADINLLLDEAKKQGLIDDKSK